MNTIINRKGYSKIIAMLLVAMLIFGLLPQTAKADDPTGDPIGKVTVSVDKFVLGQGYVIEPIQVEIYEGDTVKSVTERVNKDRAGAGVSGVKFTGSTDYVNAFYDNISPSAIIDIDPPQYVMDELDSYSFEFSDLIDTARVNDAWLTENDYFDFYGMGGMAGWTFIVNNEFPVDENDDGLTASQVELKDGDVLRYQYSLIVGADVGMPFQKWGETTYYHADKDALTALIGKINSSPYKSGILSQTGMQAAYDDAYDAIRVMLENDISGEESILSAALTALKNYKLNVSFQLVGASLSAGDVSLTVGDNPVDIVKNNGSTYLNWLPEEDYDVAFESTAGDLIDSVLATKSLAVTKNQMWNYITGITAPTSLDSYSLSEFTNGAGSGWMFFVNGDQAPVGVDQFTLEYGDKVVLSYVNDYNIIDWADPTSTKSVLAAILAFVGNDPMSQNTIDAAKQQNQDAEAYKAQELASINNVIAKINEIGTVTLNSKTKIVEARAAYDTLTSSQKAKVTNYDVLVTAEAALANLSKPAGLQNQTISVKSSFSKAIGSKSFNLNAKANGALTYSSNNNKVATVDKTGKVTLKGIGNATITINAAAVPNKFYAAPAKKVSITVTPIKLAKPKVKASKTQMTISWKKDSKASGYQIKYATKKNFKSGVKTVNIGKNKTVKKTIKGLKKGKTYYVKVRSFKKVGGKKIYSSFSSVKKIKTKK